MNSLNRVVKNMVPVCCVLIGGVFVQSFAHAQIDSAVAQAAIEQSAKEKNRLITIQEFARRLATGDEMVRAQAVEQSIANQGVRGAEAIYQPFFVASFDRDRKFLPTTAEEWAARGSATGAGGLPVPYESIVNGVKLGVEMKAATGAKVELSYNMNDIVNSLQRNLGADYISPEYKGSVGLKIDQPLLRDAGRKVTESGIELANIDKAIASETVRQVLAQRLGEALQYYIFVQRAQGRLKWRQQAFELAQKMENEISRQFENGLKSKSDLTEAQASLALRQAQVGQAKQDLEEQLNGLQVYLAAADRDQQGLASRDWVPADELRLPADVWADGLRMTNIADALQNRPEARVNALRIEREGVKRFVAEDQSKPELNMRLMYSKDSLMDRPQSLPRFFGDGQDYRTWGVGLFFRKTLGTDAKKDSEYQSALLREEQARMVKNAAEQRIANELRSMKAVLDHALGQARRQAEIVTAQQDLLEVVRQKLDQGQKSLLDVLAREMDLALAQEALVDAVAQVNRSSYVASRVNGGLLSRMGLE